MSRWVVARTEEEAAAKAAEKFPGDKIELIQDEDVLDTWQALAACILGNIKLL